MSDFEPVGKRSAPDADRSAHMSLLAKADGAHLAALWERLALAPDFEYLRPPEVGLVMLRGRVGAVGGPFNLGEATATRCAVRLASGEEGHAAALGRDKAKARIAALCDALLQTSFASRIKAEILAPIAAKMAEAAAAERAEAEATRVAFFTMQRGEG